MATQTEKHVLQSKHQTHLLRAATCGLLFRDMVLPPKPPRLEGRRRKGISPNSADATRPLKERLPNEEAMDSCRTGERMCA